MLTGAHEEALLRLLFALISGGILGYERSSKRVDAGFRTHILVCMASCAIMITNIHIYLYYGTGDLTRMPSQVISGVGFLGAGCILVTAHHRIKGVTTAAGVWASACLGLCIGSGDYLVAGFVLVMSILTMTVFRSVDEKIVKKTKYMRFYVELESVSAATNMMKYMRDRRIKVNDVEFLENKRSDTIALVTSFQLSEPDSTENVIMNFEQVEGVVFVTEI